MRKAHKQMIPGIKQRKWPVFWLILLVLNLCFIWGNSLLPREISASFSKLVGHILGLVFGGSDLTQGQGHGTLRKVAHFLEFCSLGFLLYRCALSCFRSQWMHSLLPFALGVAVAALDETIQLMIPGRGAQLRDVGIDSGGVVTGILIAILIMRLFRKRTCPIPKRQS